MSTLDTPRLRVVLQEGESASPMESADRHAYVSGLLEGGFDVSFRNSEPVKPDEDSTHTLVMGRFEGNLPASVTSSGNENSTSQSGMCHYADITNLDSVAVLAQAEEARTNAKAAEHGKWKPWFPVIDYDRCTNCMQCLTFCLFDVYGVDEKDQIRVQNNDNCKTDCPACSRVCPEVAILFPKYGKGPINGDVVRDEDIQREAMKVDVSALLGGDIYQSLRTRRTESRKRFSTERDESRALLERKRCLKKLKEDLDIPNEVLMSLPSAGDIQERAERAKAKLAKRRARSQTVQDDRPQPSQQDWGI